MGEKPLEVETIQLDLPAVVGALSRRLHEAGVPVSADRAATFARALKLVRPVSRRRLYWTARAVLISDSAQLRAFDSVFASVFGSGPAPGEPPSTEADVAPAAADSRTQARQRTVPVGPAAPQDGMFAPPRDAAQREQAIAVPTQASDEELLREKRFEALDAHELAQLYRLMARLRVATPLRRRRRTKRDRRGERIDMRRTLRESLRTGGDPIRLSRRRRRVLPRRIVMLCDISGSMEPYARAYLQFLTCAAGAGPSAEAFVFATRLTRVTRALASRNPERAIRRAAAAAPDWSSGTRIGDALKTFNDRHGRRGMARGAVMVILSDGWERGDPVVVGREMERLGRLAYRIVWVNPRVGTRDFAPRAGGMAAALPHCDALVSGHSLSSLQEVVEAIAAKQAETRSAQTGWRTSEPQVAEEQEPWGSATPVKGSSVAMPSGYGPSRGRTVPGW